MMIFDDTRLIGPSKPCWNKNAKLRNMEWKREMVWVSMKICNFFSKNKKFSIENVTNMTIATNTSKIMVTVQTEFSNGRRNRFRSPLFFGCRRRIA